MGTFLDAARATGAFGTGGWPQRLIVLLFCLFNGIVLVNAVRHDTHRGPDAGDHHDYAAVLSRGILPTHAETREFFSPPLPYALPALLMAALDRAGSRFEPDESPAAEDFKAVRRRGHRFALLANVLYSLIATFFLLKLCELLRPGNDTLKVLALLLLLMTPGYVKTFAFLRGEPLIAALTVVVLFVVIRDVMERRRIGALPAAALGVLLGLLVLSRQWGFFLIPALVFWLALPAVRRGLKPAALAAYLALAGAAAFDVGGWFYLHLLTDSGSAAAFNRPAAPEILLGGKDRRFFTDLWSPELFRNPRHPHLNATFFPIMYADTWGDYRGHFLTTVARTPRADSYRGPEPTDSARELSRLMVVSLIPSAVLLGGLLVGAFALYRSLLPRGRAGETNTEGLSLSLLAVIFYAGGYVWFVDTHTFLPSTDTVKFCYVVQVMPLLCLLGAEFLVRMREKAPRLFAAATALLVAVALHNLPFLFTRYVVS